MSLGRLAPINPADYRIACCRDRRPVLSGRLPQAFAKFCGITWTVAYCLGVSNGAACELEGLSSAFAGLLPHCALSGLLAQRKSEFQSHQPENGQPIETAECRFGDRRGGLARRHGSRL